MRAIAFFAFLILGLQVEAGRVSTEGACDEGTRPRVITEPGVTFVSPNYPEEYPPNSTCEWLYLPTGLNDTLATLEFSDFGLPICANCSCDAVEVYDGEDDQSPLVDRFCGPTTPGTITASGASLFVRFLSDDSDQVGAGFEAQFDSLVEPDYACVMGERPRIIHDHEGNITSPNHPGDYDPMSLCEWVFDPPENWVVEISVKTFELEDCCICDYLEVFNGDSVNDVRFGHWFNVDRVPTITSSGENLLVRFRSDGSYHFSGFLIDYRMYNP